MSLNNNFILLVNLCYVVLRKSYAEKRREEKVFEFLYIN